MRCWEARDALWPPERPRLLGPDVERARAHVSTCPECTGYFAQDRTVLEACRELGSLKAPLGVRARVYEAVANAERGRVREAGREQGSGSDGFDQGRRRRLLAGAVAGVAGLLGALVVLAMAGVGGPGASDRDAPPEEQAYVEDYLRRAVGQDFLDSSDPDVIARFLHRELGLRSRLLRTPGLVPSRVEICLLEGHRGAMVVYHMDGRSVTHYLVPRDSRRRSPRVADDQGGLSVVIWSSGTTEEALVGEVPSEELLSLARENGVG